MIKLINMYFFKGWSKRERREFWIALIITIITCLGLIYLTEILEVTIGRHNCLANTIYNVT